MLCYLVPDSRSKADHNKIVIFCDVSCMEINFCKYVFSYVIVFTVQVTDDVTIIPSLHQNEPYVIVFGGVHNPQQAFLVMDKKY